MSDSTVGIGSLLGRACAQQPLKPQKAHPGWVLAWIVIATLQLSEKLMYRKSSINEVHLCLNTNLKTKAPQQHAVSLGHAGTCLRQM